MMSVQSVSNQNANLYQYTNVQGSHKDAQNTAEDLFAPLDTYEKSTEYTPDLDKVKAMKADFSQSVEQLKQMVIHLFQKQGKHHSSAMDQLGKTVDQMSEIDKETQAWAQSAIAEDGEWGAEQVSKRILEFATALSGGDPAKIDELQSAFEKGFQEAEKLWGGKLPDISYQTYDKVMSGFEEMRNPSKAEEEA